MLAVFVRSISTWKKRKVTSGISTCYGAMIWTFKECQCCKDFRAVKAMIRWNWQVKTSCIKGIWRYSICSSNESMIVAYKRFRPPFHIWVKIALHSYLILTQALWKTQKNSSDMRPALVLRESLKTPYPFLSPRIHMNTLRLCGKEIRLTITIACRKSRLKPLPFAPLVPRPHRLQNFRLMTYHHRHPILLQLRLQLLYLRIWQHILSCVNNRTERLICLQHTLNLCLVALWFSHK